MSIRNNNIILYEKHIVQQNALKTISNRIHQTGYLMQQRITARVVEVCTRTNHRRVEFNRDDLSAYDVEVNSALK